MRLTHIARRVLRQERRPLATGEIIAIARNQGLIPPEFHDAEKEMARLLSRYVRVKVKDIECLRTGVWAIRFYEGDDVKGWPEGAVVKVTANRYERDPRNREACINKHGCRCVVCEMDFEDVYGDLGKNFVEVHHLTPVSRLRAAYSVNPVLDLVPVCPNCHAMLHRKTPPLSPEQLRRAREAVLTQSARVPRPQQMSML